MSKAILAYSCKGSVDSIVLVEITLTLYLYFKQLLNNINGSNLDSFHSEDPTRIVGHRRPGNRESRLIPTKINGRNPITFSMVE